MNAPVAAGVVVVGGGVAAVAAVRALRAAAYDGAIDLFSDESVEPYDRPPLSKQYLAGALAVQEISLFRDGEIEELAVTVQTGRAAVSLDVAGRRVTLDDGSTIAFRALIVATGAQARRLPLGDGLEGIHYLRSLSDADALRTSLRTARHLVVVGAGFIGLEVAATARCAGVQVTVLEAARVPLSRVLGAEAGHQVTELHRQRGTALRFGVNVVGVGGSDRVEHVDVEVEGVRERIAADTVVVGVGAVPRTSWLADSTVDVNDGIVCDEGGRTSAPGIYAAGDVSRWVNRLTDVHARVEQWQSATEQGGIVGANVAADLGMPGAEPLTWSSVPYFWSDQFEHKVQFCGAPGPVWEGRQTARGWVACYADAEDGVLTGVLAIDGPVALARGRRHVASGATWSQARVWLAAL